MEAIQNLSEEFESSVNLQGSKTNAKWQCYPRWFESSVNLQGSKTDVNAAKTKLEFESSVNLQGSKTVRALLSCVTSV